MIRWYFSSSKETRLRVLNKRKKGSFLYVHQPFSEDLEYLQKTIGLDNGLISDALDPEEVPRAEYLDKILYIFLRVPLQRDTVLETVPVLCAVSRAECCILSQNKLPFLESALTTARFDTTESISCALQLMSLIATEYDTTITRLNKSLYRLRRSIEKITAKQILNFVTSEEEMNDVLNSLTRMLLALQSLFGSKKIKLTEEQTELFQDLVLELDQLVMSAKNNLRSIKNTHEAYTSIMTNNLNKVIKLFTSLTVILTVPTIISSFFGMNVRLPLQEHSLGFAVVLGTTVALVMCLVYLFNKNDWF